MGVCVKSPRIPPLDLICARESRLAPMAYLNSTSCRFGTSTGKKSQLDRAQSGVAVREHYRTSFGGTHSGMLFHSNFSLSLLNASSAAFGNKSR